MYGKPPPSEWDEWPETKAAFEEGWRAAFRASSDDTDGLIYITRDNADVDRAYYDGRMAGTEAKYLSESWKRAERRMEEG